MKSKLFLLAGTALLAGCATNKRPRPRPSPLPKRAAAGRTRAQARDRRLRLRRDRHGHDRPARATISTSIANGTWAQEHADPGRQVQLRHVHHARRSVAASGPATIIEEAAKDPNSKIGAAYASFLDEAAVEAKGLAPFEPWLERDPRASSRRRGYPALFADADRIGIGTPFAGFVGQDDKAARPIYPELSSRAASACPTAIII